MIFNTVLISFSLDTLSVGDNKDKTNVPILSLFHGAIRSVQSSSENYSTNCGRRSGLMVSALVPRASGLGSSAGWGHCVVFLGKTLDSHSVSLHPGV